MFIAVSKLDVIYLKVYLKSQRFGNFKSVKDEGLQSFMQVLKSANKLIQMFNILFDVFILP